MLKKIGTLAIACLISACSMPTFFESNDLNTNTTKIDQQSYAYAYDITVQGKKGMVTENFYVDKFNQGVRDWYNHRILVPIDEIQNTLYKNGSGHNSQNYAYFSGVVFAYELRDKLKLFSQNCYHAIDVPSLSLGIQDAMVDLKNQEPKDFEKTTEQFLKTCS